MMSLDRCPVPRVGRPAKLAFHAKTGKICERPQRLAKIRKDRINVHDEATVTTDEHSECQFFRC